MNSRGRGGKRDRGGEHHKLFQCIEMCIGVKTPQETPAGTAAPWLRKTWQRWMGSAAHTPASPRTLAMGTERPGLHGQRDNHSGKVREWRRAIKSEHGGGHRSPPGRCQAGHTSTSSIPPLCTAMGGGAATQGRRGTVQPLPADPQDLPLPPAHAPHPRGSACSGGTRTALSHSSFPTSLPPWGQLPLPMEKDGRRVRPVLLRSWTPQPRGPGGIFPAGKPPAPQLTHWQYCSGL